MELALPLIAIPATIALFFKIAVYIYTRMSNVARSVATRLFLMILLVFAVENIAEISGFYRINIKSTIPYAEGILVFITLAVGFALLFHLTLVLAFGEQSGFRTILQKVVYIVATILTILIIFTPWIVKDFTVLSYGIGNTITRIPGPLYPVFEIYFVAVLFGIVTVPIYGSRKQGLFERQMQNRILLIAIVPTVALGFAVATLLHFGIKWFNISMTLPVAITYFLIVTAYAIHNHRFLDARFSKSEFIRLQEDLVATIAQLHELKKRVPSHDDMQTMTLNDRVTELETRLISMALEQCGGNKAKAAAMLGLRPNTLHYKIGRCGLAGEKNETEFDV